MNIATVYLRRALAAFAVAASGTAAAAQRADSTSLPRVVVTATRVETSLGSRLSSVAVLEGDSLRRMGVQNLADALRLVPGVSIARSGGQGAQTSIFMRGGESDYVRVLVDGVPMNDPGGSIDLAHFSLDDVERIEVVRGPVSVLYGTDAVAGVIQIFTRQSSGERGIGGGTTVTSVDAAARLGSYDARAGDVSLGVGGPRAGGTLAVSTARSDGILPFNNQYRDDGAIARAVLRGERGSRLAISGRLKDDVYHYPTDGAGAVVDQNAYRSDRRTSVAVDAEQPLGARLKAVASFTALEGDGRTEDAPDSPADTLGFFAYRSAGSVRRRVADGRLELSVAPSTVASLGAEWSLEKQRNTDTSSFGGPRTHFAAERANHALYGQLLGERGRLSYVIGGRYDDNETFGIFRTARAAASVQAWSGGTLRASIGTAFKAPTFLETFSSAFSTGNPALVPERARSWELGAEQVFSPGRLTLTAAWFQQQFHDLIQYTFQVDPSAPNYFNVAAASARGLELEVIGQPASGIQARASTTFLRTRVEDAGFDSGEGATFVEGQPLLRRPAVSATLALRATRSPRVTFDVSATYVGARDDRDFSTFPATPIELEGYVRVDAAAAYRIGEATGSGIATTLLLRADNLLGEEYQEVFAFPAPKRVVTIGLRMERHR